MSAANPDTRVRLAAFDWLQDQVRIHGDVLPRRLLSQGFTLDGVRVPLVGPQGIFKPRVIPQIPLSITTIPGGPYDDKVEQGDLLQYRYRGTNPDHHDNVGLRKAMSSRVPLVHFFRLIKGKYLASWPVYIVGDNPQSLTFTVAFDDATYVSKELHGAMTVSEPQPEARRKYVTAQVKVRLHQRLFRERVLEAYREQCALCRLRHAELLDAAHIIPDADPGGEPSVPNGLALCKLHHAAYDKHFLAIRPDYTIEIRRSILEEDDGPMLLHGLKEMHETSISVPRKQILQPDPALLERRYEQFTQQNG